MYFTKNYLTMSIQGKRGRPFWKNLPGDSPLLGRSGKPTQNPAEKIFPDDCPLFGGSRKPTKVPCWNFSREPLPPFFEKIPGGLTPFGSFWELAIRHCPLTNVLWYNVEWNNTCEASEYGL
jgi:hypothetical protein